MTVLEHPRYIQQYKSKEKEFDKACCLYPCAPFVSIEKLNEAYNKLDSFDTVFPIVEYSFPIQRALIKDESDKIAFIQPEFELSRSQDLTASYHDAGQFYWFDINKSIENKSIMSNNTGCVLLTEMEVQDIDNGIDWQLAELKYKLNNGVS